MFAQSKSLVLKLWWFVDPFYRLSNTGDPLLRPFSQKSNKDQYEKKGYYIKTAFDFFTLVPKVNPTPKKEFCLWLLGKCPMASLKTHGLNQFKP